MLESEIIRYSAPGKLFLLGEYGVLAGGWTVVAAMNRRVEACKMSQARGYRAVGAGADATLRLPQAVLTAIRGAGQQEESIDFYETDVRSFFEGAQKLGLGSSAASVVALSAASLHQKQPEMAVDDVFQTAFHAHRLLQNGRGSGADVAASAYGGLLGYRLDTSTPPFALQRGQAEFESERNLVGTRVLSGLRWPEELEVRAVWTGTSASSTALIGRIEGALATHPNKVSDVLLEISKTAEAGIFALQTPNASEFIRVFAKADELMGSLGDLTGAPIITECHRELRSLARQYGVVAKPSGAGGGDFSLLLGMRDAPWDCIERALPAGCAVVDLQIDMCGVKRDHAALERLS